MVVYFLDPTFPQVSAVDSLSVVVGDLGGLAGPRDGVVLIMDEPDEFASLLVRHLHVLSYHTNLLCFDQRLSKIIFIRFMSRFKIVSHCCYFSQQKPT